VRRITFRPAVGNLRHAYDNIRAAMEEPVIFATTASRSRAQGSVSWLIGGLISVALVVYWPTTAALWRYWTEEPSLGGHGMLVIALAAWLLLRERARLAVAPLHPFLPAVLLVLLCSLASLLFQRAGIQSIQLLVLPALIWFSVLAAFGTAVARLMAVPVAYLYFSMPAWNLLSAPLQHLTTTVVRIVAPLIGLPVTTSGSVVTFPNGDAFVVTLACSGVGFLVQGLAVAALLGELEGASVSRRLKLLAAMLMVALLTNWIRVMLLLLLGYQGGMDNPIVARHHLEFGYVLFVLALVVFVWLATRKGLAPSTHAEVHTDASESPFSSAYLMALISLAVIPVGFASQAQPQVEVDQAWRLPPVGRGDWIGPTVSEDASWRPVFVGPHAQWHVRYTNSGGHSVESVLVGYLTQAQGRELVNESNSLLGDGGLTAIANGTVDSNGQRYREIMVRDPQGRTSLIWWFYDIGGRMFITPMYSQLWYGARSFGLPPYSRLLAFRAACDQSCGEARGRLTDFMGEISSQLQAPASRIALETLAGHGPT
jgi:EpsI family protein